MPISTPHSLYEKLRQIITNLPERAISMDLHLEANEIPTMLVQQHPMDSPDGEPSSSESRYELFKVLPVEQYDVLMAACGPTVSNGVEFPIGAATERFVWVVSMGDAGSTDAPTAVLCMSESGRDETTVRFCRSRNAHAEYTLRELMHGNRPGGANMVVFPDGHWVQWDRRHIRVQP